MSENTPGWIARLAPARRAPNPDLPPLPATVVRAPRPSEDHPAALAVPRSVRSTAAWSWRILVIAAATALLGYLVFVFRLVVVSFIIAVLLAVFLDPVSAWLRKQLRFPRVVAALATVVVLITVVIGLLALAGQQLVAGFSGLADQAAAGFDQLLAWLSDGPLAIDEEQVSLWVDQGLAQIQANAGTLASGALSATSSVIEVGAGALITVFCLFFFLKDGRGIWQWFVRLTPPVSRNTLNEAGIRGWITLGGYVRAQILVAFVDAVGIGLGAWFLGLPLVVPLAILVFLGAFIPIVGATLTGAIAVLVALVDQGLGTAVAMLAVVLVVQQLEGNVLQPWLMGNAVSLHPVAVLLAVTAGTGLAGILGALLAVPIVAVLNTVVLYVHGHDKHPKAATDWYRPGGPPGTLFRSIEDSYAQSSGDEEDDVPVDTATVRTEANDAGRERAEDEEPPPGQDAR